MNSAENSDGMAVGDGDAREVFDAVDERTKLITSKVNSKLHFHKDVAMEYLELKDVMSDFAEEMSKLKRELARLQVLAAAATGDLGAARQELADTREALAQRNRQLDEKEEELATATEELAAARQQLAQRNHKLDEKNEELKALRLKLQEMETRNCQAEQLDGSAADPDPSQVQIQTTRRQTRSMQHEKRKFSGHCASREDNLEVVREKLIKGFMELVVGPRELGVKEIRKLNGYSFDGTLAYDLWNYKEGRKATFGECIDYLFDQVKQLTIFHRRKSRKTVNDVSCAAAYEPSEDSTNN